MGYALITGASKGIGKAMAFELAKKGFDVLLVARSEDLLKEVASNVTKTHGVKADYLVADLSDPQSPKKILDWCHANNYDVTVLVNNAGYGLSGRFKNYALYDHEDMM